MEYNILMAKPNVTGPELAISGSIILVVGIALVVTIPIFSMNHRNSERIRDMNLIADSLVEWQENHRGELPDSEELTTATGLGDLTDPDGTTYTYVLNNRAGKAAADTMTLKRESALNHKV